MDWLKDRLKERTSLDGAVAIGGGIVMILIPTSLILVFGATALAKSSIL